ncbi:mitochondrial substrate carrier family protein [Klebsormidium nitens]|uniref:Mitochondrial substrate carrier family protein n=1 Tax=Klebsormidium nitens TaxID=105231 RepID=A0A0U9HJP4_KLENI|nr:mitochondrial substrate carrier family protein [Klebsormidium nitens]|eukprot:GAQ77631.1 mitochondrial substrate carrier family protein [Klebsormidium nitens]
MQHFQRSLQATAQRLPHQFKRPPGQSPRRRKANRGLHLVSAVGNPARAKVGASSSASGVGASKNALAGGLAGGLVALSLYPVDTIKTLVQAETGAGQRSIPRIFQKLVEKHGMFGLYRGLGSNLVTATPISAIYASTYEAVKEVLLPHLPPKFQSVAHCSAGAAASVATSFVFTPSEVVKQRMQYTSQYANSWSAFLGILRTEGITSLYNGWGAVLARNIPNSIIKFYTYESLKKLALDRRPGATRLTQLESLVIGGVSGVSAAFCTTPFDVVKTRLQNQMPGQTIQYGGVTECLRKIVAEEGVAGLYRGVGPRLFIYVSQGAIFFASYEVLKRVLQDEWRIAPREGGTIGYKESAPAPLQKAAKIG